MVVTLLQCLELKEDVSRNFIGSKDTGEKEREGRNFLYSNGLASLTIFPYKAAASVQEK